MLGDGRSLGLTIRGGAEYGLGIYITGVDPGSEAEISGLKVRGQWTMGCVGMWVGQVKVGGGPTEDWISWEPRWLLGLQCTALSPQAASFTPQAVGQSSSFEAAVL